MNIQSIIKYPNRLIKKYAMKTTWWKKQFVDPDHQIYPDNVWYREHEERNYDVVNLGSSAAKYAFQYDGLPIKAMNWAQQPQTLLDDFRLLKNFHSILRKKGTVILTIMPFTSLNKDTNVTDVLKYVGTLNYTLLDERYRDEAYSRANNPRSLGSTKMVMKQAAKYLLGRDSGKKETVVLKTAMTDEELKTNSQIFMECWKKEFEITDWEAPLTDKNKEGRAIRVKTMQEILDFCKERDYRLVCVFPPISRQLNACISHTLKKLYIYDYMQEAAPDIEFLDYMTDIRFVKDEYFYNCLFLNQTGARLFTKQVLTDIGLLK